jgi:hypothetical protein
MKSSEMKSEKIIKTMKHGINWILFAVPESSLRENFISSGAGFNQTQSEKNVHQNRGL